MAYLFPYAGSEGRREKHPYYKELERQERVKRRNLPVNPPREIPKVEPPTPLTQEQTKFAGLSEVPPSLRGIMVEVCREHKVVPADLRGLDSRKHVVQARRVYCIRARNETDASFCKIARSLCRDHTTVIYFVKQGYAGHSLEPVKHTVIPPLGVRRRPIVTEPTPLENEYARLVAEGFNPKEIAQKMNKSASCVRHYKNSLKKKAALASELEKKDD